MITHADRAGAHRPGATPRSRAASISTCGPVLEHHAIDALSRTEGVALYAPFWTRYFFAYLDANAFMDD